MNAMIFAAGIGSRLSPLTNSTPKALVEVGGKTMLERVINHLKDYGFTELIINIHHFPGKIKTYLKAHNHFGVDITFSEEQPDLLDTGGGLKKASWFFNTQQPFLIHNVDILSNLNLNRLLDFHREHDAIATLVVRERASSRYLLFNEENRLCGWENAVTGKRIIIQQASKMKRLAFSGIHLTHASIFNHMPPKNSFSIVETYLKAAKEEKIFAYIDRDSYWFDIGNLKNLEKARDFLMSK